MKQIIFLLVAMLFIASTARATEVLDWPGFENGSLQGWKLSRLPRKDSAKVITSPTRSGKFAASVTLKNGETYGDSWKSELTDPYYAPFGIELWYRVSHFLPQNFTPTNGNRCVLAQWHNLQPPGIPGGAPPLAHEYKDGKLRVFVSYSIKDFQSGKDVINKNLFIIPMAKNRWHDFVYRINWSRGGTSRIDAWYNGVYMGTYSGRLGYPNDVRGPYFKTGVYCKQSPITPLTAFVDEYARGYIFETVLLPGEKLQAFPQPRFF